MNVMKPSVQENMRNKVIALLDRLGNPYQIMSNCLVIDYPLQEKYRQEILRICGNLLTCSVEKNVYFERTIFGEAEDLMRLYFNNEFHEIRRRKWKSIIDQGNLTQPSYYEKLPKDLRYWLETGFHTKHAMAIFNLTIAGTVVGFSNQFETSKADYPTNLFEFNHCGLAIASLPSIQGYFDDLANISVGWRFFTQNYDYFSKKIREIGESHQNPEKDASLDISALEAEYVFRLNVEMASDFVKLSDEEKS